MTNRDIMQQALDALTHHRQQTTYRFCETNSAIKALENELAKPEPIIVPFPSFMRKRVEQAIDNSINSKGMSTHDSKARVLISDLKLMLLIADLAAKQLDKPEQDHGFDRTASHMVGEYVDTAQSDNQGPLAWATFDGEGNFDFRSYEDNETYRDDYLKRNGKKYTNWVLPLYVAPPRKPWVGLTDEEIELLVSQAREVPIEIPCDSFTTRLLKLAETKLKELNK